MNRYCPNCGLRYTKEAFHGNCSLCGHRLHPDNRVFGNNTGSTCPECGSPTTPQEGCETCLTCGWSKCG